MERRIRSRLGLAWFMAKWRLRPAVGVPRMSLRTLMKLAYPNPLPRDLDLETKAYRAVGSNRIHGLHSLRAVLAALDHHSAPSPLSVRFGRDDIVEVLVDGVRIALDTADTSVSEPMIRNRKYEPEVTRVLREFIRPGMTVLDIGANVGFFTALSAGLVGESGRVIAVEPSSENCRLILRTAEINQFANVELLPVALAEANGWSHFVNHLGSNGSLAGAPESALVDGWGQIVPVMRGDDLIEGPIDVVKMDVEGAEARVVRGMSGLIEAHRPVIVTEASEEMLKRVSDSSLAEYLTWFEDRDYSIHLISTTSETPIAFPDVAALLATWNDPFRIENFLLLPSDVGPI
jgi:FkbM family methyltransferase